MTIFKYKKSYIVACDYNIWTIKLHIEADNTSTNYEKPDYGDINKYEYEYYFCCHNNNDNDKSNKDYKCGNIFFF